MSEPTPARSRRDALLDAADAVIRRQGAGASMRAIAAEAGITKPILYRHFGDKAGLYRALAERYAEPLLAEVRAALDAAPGGRDSLAAGLEAYLRFVVEHPEVYRFLVHGPRDDEGGTQPIVAEVTRRIGEVLADRLRANLGVPDHRATVWGHGIVGAAHVAGQAWLEAPRTDRAVLVDDLAALLWDGITGLAATAAAS